MNREVNLTKRIRLADGTTRFASVVYSANGRIKPDYVLVDGKEAKHTEGKYYIDWYEGNSSKRIRRSVGKDAAQAAAKRHLQEGILAAKHSGMKNVPELQAGSDGTGKALVNAVALYLEDIRLTKKPKTLAAYTTALNYFMESCTKATVAEVQRTDLLKFAAFLRDEKQLAPRSVYNKFESVMSFLKAQGVRGLIGKNDWPRYTEEEPEVFERDVLTEFLGECDAEERIWFEFFLMTGMREQEVMHTYWSDINLAAATVRVSHKPGHGWTPKAYKEREIPIPAALVASLKQFKKRASASCPLLFPTRGCNPKLDFLDCCKAIAERAKLNPEEFWLHKFRATFATWHLWAGVDLRTVQLWMGHTDMESTVRYLKPNRSQAVHEKVNQTFA